MSKKEILIPFDLAKAKAGAKLRTTKGEDARIVCYDAGIVCYNAISGNSDFKLLVLCRKSANEYVQYYREDGTSSEAGVCLQIVEEVEEPDRWIDRMGGKVKGWCLAYKGEAVLAFSSGKEKDCWKSIFVKKKQAQAAAAAAQISQIMANDKRFGGVITDKEWATNGLTKFVVCRQQNHLRCVEEETTFVLLAFHTAAQRELFLQENLDLVQQYYML